MMGQNHCKRWKKVDSGFVNEMEIVLPQISASFEIRMGGVIWLSLYATSNDKYEINCLQSQAFNIVWNNFSRKLRVN